MHAYKHRFIRPIGASGEKKSRDSDVMSVCVEGRPWRLPTAKTDPSPVFFVVGTPSDHIPQQDPEYIGPIQDVLSLLSARSARFIQIGSKPPKFRPRPFRRWNVWEGQVGRKGGNFEDVELTRTDCLAVFERGIGDFREWRRWEDAVDCSAFLWLCLRILLGWRCKWEIFCDLQSRNGNMLFWEQPLWKKTVFK